jgi:signal transduction histidine kinase
LEKQEIQNAYQEGLLQMQNAQLRRERMLRNLLVGALLVLVLAVGLLLAKMRSERAAKARAEQLNRELTEREQALHRANDDLRRAIAEKDDLLGVVSHDLKNPIGAIQGIADLLQEDMPKGASEDFREMVGMVRTTAERMFAVVSDLLDSYRSGSASSERNRATVDLVEICHASASMWTKRIAEKQQTLHLDLPDHPLPFVGDPTSLHQIVDNLLSNAIKYTPLGKELGVRLSVVDTTVRLEVWDQGPGIPEDEQPLLFQKFAKVSNQPTGGEHSSGLGLSIVKRRVEDLGGTVRCESEPGQGSRFIVELPLIAP